MDKLRINITSETIYAISKASLDVGICQIDLSDYINIDYILNIFSSVKIGQYYNTLIKYEYNPKNNLLTMYRWPFCDIIIEYYSIQNQRNLRIDKLLSQ